MYNLYKYPILVGGGPVMSLQFIQNQHANSMVGGSDGSSGDSTMMTFDELQKLFYGSSSEINKMANIVMGRAAIRGVKYNPVEYVNFKNDLGEEDIPGRNKFLTIQYFAQKIFDTGFQLIDRIKLPKGKNSGDVLLEIRKIIERKVDKDFPHDFLRKVDKDFVRYDFLS